MKINPVYKHLPDHAVKNSIKLEINCMLNVLLFSANVLPPKCKILFLCLKGQVCSHVVWLYSLLSVCNLILNPEIHKLCDAVITCFRNQLQDDLRENHPFFDTPLFTVGRESRFRKLCQVIVNAKYNYLLRDPVTGKEMNHAFKRYM